MPAVQITRLQVRQGSLISELWCAGKTSLIRWQSLSLRE